MANQSFWLADIGDHTVVVSYIDATNSDGKVTSIGPACPWDESNPQSFTTAIDQSLSESANSINLPAESEPDVIALIIPPFWVGSDGKIIISKRKLLETMSKELKLKPMGFIANDEAIVEAANLADGYPASFILVNFSPSDIVVSLAYLGRVIERISKNISNSFNPELLESAILEFRSESALPPQIILFGQVDETNSDAVKNFAWIGKKNIETFLHFPEVKTYDSTTVTNIYAHAISSQFSISSPKPPEVLEPEIIPEPTPQLILTPEIETTTKTIAHPDLVEVSPEELGFADINEEQNFTIPVTIPEIIPELVEQSIEPNPLKKKFAPKFTVPKLKLPALNLLLLPVVISPILLLIPFIFSTAQITIFLTPYEFNKTATVTFDPQAQEVDLSKKIIPINRQSIQIPTSLSLATTGQKTVGDKAKGELTIFNKQDKVQSLASGSVILDAKGNKFILDNNVQVPASSSNLDLGVITLGQVKVMATAADIGSEYNLTKDSSLHFKDYSESLIVAKVITGFSGGSKRQINAVSLADKSQLEAKIASEINAAVNKKLDQEISVKPGIIRDATQIIKGRIEYNREVGEESDQLTGSVTSSIYLFYLDPQKKLELINSLLSQEKGFDVSTIDPAKFNLSISSAKGSVDKITGQLIISGSSLPKVDSQSIAKLVSGKFQKSAIEIIKNKIPRAYNYKIDTNFKLIQMVNPMPFRLQNIHIVIK